jgi:8-oxo-dGTP pyrophosphatase MutT (NUDIX family)
MQASRCRPVFQSTELRQTISGHKAREPGVKSKKGKIGSSGKPRRRKVKLAVRMQYGVLPYRFSQDAALEILLVTTRGTRRWIVPKGWPIKGLSPAKSAAREAFEEAGVTGRIGAKPIGFFAYDKLLDEAGGTTMCEVKIYPLLVKRQSHVWPESHQRTTQWVEASRAIAMIKESGLKKIVASFAKRAAAAASRAAF